MLNDAYAIYHQLISKSNEINDYSFEMACKKYMEEKTQCCGVSYKGYTTNILIQMPDFLSLFLAFLCKSKHMKTHFAN